MSDEAAGESFADDERLADRVADPADRIARGEEPGLGSDDPGDLDGSGALSRLLPAIRWLSGLADGGPPDPRAAWMGPGGRNPARATPSRELRP